MNSICEHGFELKGKKDLWVKTLYLLGISVWHKPNRNCRIVGTNSTSYKQHFFLYKHSFMNIANPTNLRGNQCEVHQLRLLQSANVTAASKQIYLAMLQVFCLLHTNNSLTNTYVYIICSCINSNMYTIAISDVHYISLDKKLKSRSIAFYES